MQNEEKLNKEGINADGYSFDGNKIMCAHLRNL